MNYANFRLLFHIQKWEMPIFQMNERFCFLPTDTFIKLCHHWPGQLLSAAPGRSTDGGRRWSGGKESRGTQLMAESVSSYAKDAPTGSEGFTSSSTWASGTSRLDRRT